ncbi:hypothetical protein L9641_002863, partial [Proteus mirabilis]
LFRKIKYVMGILAFFDNTDLGWLLRANEQNAIDNKLKMTKKLFNSFIMKLSSLPSHILQNSPRFG